MNDSAFRGVFNGTSGHVEEASRGHCGESSIFPQFGRKLVQGTAHRPQEPPMRFRSHLGAKFPDPLQTFSQAGRRRFEPRYPAPN